MSNSMIERMARAYSLWRVMDRDSRKADDPYVVGWVNDRWQDFIEPTRAVLAAMRDFPDQLGNSLPEGYKPGSHSAREIWNSVIDGALADDDR